MDNLLYEHSTQEKAKARKSGPSILRKAEELAEVAHTFVAFIYWDPTHLCHRVAARLPEGETLPDINSLVRITSLLLPISQAKG